MAKEKIPPPKNIGDRSKEIDITGYLFPWKDGQPFFMQMLGSKATYIPVFEDKIKLDIGMNGIEYEKIKQIEDGQQFLDSIPTKYIVIVNLRYTSDGKCRYIQLFRGVWLIDDTS